ncbi:hypothetical protein LJR098_006141 [Rhizobium sp. LjRoot98]|uniref:hypothetical protein n=1 Tax=unclassified Rhizobium TaxID=2613769 RepID=UPI000712B608|nr:hypothetical protein [Rhizobium sp. Root1204]KQV41604.1 hypothetical protein ASC96_17545 [Rhizobium sp. Root1204]
MAAQIDMFSNEPDDIPAAPDRDPKPKKATYAVINEAEIVQHLIDTGRYRVVTKLRHRRPQFGLKGVIIDTETTGLNCASS